FRNIQKDNNSGEIQNLGIPLQGLNSGRTVTKERDKAKDEKIFFASNSTDFTPSPKTLKRPPMNDSQNSLESGLKGHKIVHVLPTKKKKVGAMRKCRICAKHGVRKETSGMCANCGSLQDSLFQQLPYQEKLLKRYENTSKHEILII
ncbi:hypothetical protein C0J52_25503, partial [Blattella germanica]